MKIFRISLSSILSNIHLNCNYFIARLSRRLQSGLNQNTGHSVMNCQISFELSELLVPCKEAEKIARYKVLVITKCLT